METYRQEVKIALANVQNDANKTISHLKAQVLIEKGEIVNQQQESFKVLEEKLKSKENKLNESIKSIEEREDLWEKEKADVLEEVQRLKAEALHMVSKLASEYEEENSGDEKRRSLSQEVFCLQIVVEMKTDEMRNLREQVALTEQELEQFGISKKKLKTVLARIEDLEEQIVIKERAEK